MSGRPDGADASDRRGLGDCRGGNHHNWWCRRRTTMTGTLLRTPPISYVGPTTFGLIKTFPLSVKVSSFHVIGVVEPRRKPPLLAVLLAGPPPVEVFEDLT
ncbi:hypothetical protein Sjap_018005 [Stephania japonica]|uniref:Uncharacterized protein n=1 Tax=Stephania japonica TaxID=461633 RepID=A0AAP0NL34_9MAGN